MAGNSSLGSLALGARSELQRIRRADWLGASTRYYVARDRVQYGRWRLLGNNREISESFMTHFNDSSKISFKCAIIHNSDKHT